MFGPRCSSTRPAPSIELGRLRRSSGKRRLGTWFSLEVPGLRELESLCMVAERAGVLVSRWCDWIRNPDDLELRAAAFYGDGAARLLSLLRLAFSP